MPDDAANCWGLCFSPHLLTPCCDREECEQYVSSVWDWLEGLGTGVSRADPSTWAPPQWPPSYRGVINTLEARQICMSSICKNNLSNRKGGKALAKKFVRLERTLHIQWTTLESALRLALLRESCR